MFDLIVQMTNLLTFYGDFGFEEYNECLFLTLFIYSGFIKKKPLSHNYLK